MKSLRYSLCRFLAIPVLATMTSTLMISQQEAREAFTAVPRLVNFAGNVTDAAGKAISGVAGVTFAIYNDQSEGVPLWLETQSVTADAKGNYAAQLGASKSGGLPLELFSSGEARWLGVRVNGGPEQARVLLLSVPYALKAEDAATLGGLPPSAFVLAGVPITGASPANSDSPSSASSSPQALPPATVSGSGTANYVPRWTGAATIGNSVMFQAGSGTAAKLGINTTTPATMLDVKGATTIRGVLSLPAPAAATASAGQRSQPLSLTASAFNSATSTAIGQTFRWQAEPANNNTADPSAILSLLYGQGETPPAETGLLIGPKGVISFSPIQTFPGTLTSVGLTAPATDFTVSGSPLTHNGTLGLHWNVAPTSANAANSIVKRDPSGNFAATVITAYNLTATNTSGAAVVGQSTGTSGGSDGVHGVTSSASASGVAGVNTADGIGVYGTGGIGVYGTSSTQQAIWGETYATGFANGSGPDGVHGVTHSANGSGVGGLNWADGGVGVWGEAPTGVGFYTPNNVRQERSAGGWVKAMVYVNGYKAPYDIIRCYNSTLAGPEATTPPCGISLKEIRQGIWDLDFGFQINDRFVSATAGSNSTVINTCLSDASENPACAKLSPNQIRVATWNKDDLGTVRGARFHLIIY